MAAQTLDIRLVRPALICGGHSEDVFIEHEGYHWGDIRKPATIEQVRQRVIELYNEWKKEYLRWNELFITAIVWKRNKGRYSISTSADLRSYYYKRMVILKTVQKRIDAGIIKIELEKYE